MPNQKPRLPRAVAKSRGIPRFFTGVPCIRGHVADRITASGNCLLCQRIANSTHYQKSLKGRRRTDINERIRQQGRAYIERNADAINQRRRDRYAERRDEMIARRRRYYEENLPSIIASNRKTTAARMRRVPPWLTPDDFASISRMYTDAADISKATGVKHHVDHIIPLQGRRVSGLHVPWNLQIITAEENMRKGNRCEETTAQNGGVK